MLVLRFLHENIKNCNGNLTKFAVCIKERQLKILIALLYQILLN